MSSHREAPEISKDPVADSTDVYAFVSPDKPDTVTLIANYIPLQGPAGGPNFYEFGDDVLYEIHVDNNGDGRADISFQFRFTTEVLNPDTFLYNTGPIEALDSPDWNRRQTYDVTVSSGSSGQTIGSGLACPPCNIGPLSTPNYPALAAQAMHNLGDGITVFAGQRAEGFYVDLGSIFDLGNLRPFENLHAQYGLNVFSGPAQGVNATNHLNVHSITIQVPISSLTRSGHPTIGVWTTASRQRVRLWDADNGENVDSGPFRQVSRLGNPLVNEVLIPLGRKDQWNSLPPSDDKLFAGYVTQPGLAALLPGLYPGVFPNLAALVASAKPRADLEAILLTGIPSGIIPGFQNFTGPVLADMLRLNTSIPPTSPSKQSIYGLLGGDAAGFPNGRRVTDNVVAIELRAIAGVTYALVNKSFKPDAAAGKLTDGLTPASVSSPYLTQFPYLGVPLQRFRQPVLIAGAQHERASRRPFRPGHRHHGTRRRHRRPDPVHAGRNGRQGDRDQLRRRTRRSRVPAHALPGPAASHARRDQVRGRLPRPAGRALHDLARRAQPGGRRHRHRRAGQQLPLARLSRRVLRALASAWGRPAPLPA